jgi:hypothetical protein
VSSYKNRSISTLMAFLTYAVQMSRIHGKGFAAAQQTGANANAIARLLAHGTSTASRAMAFFTKCDAACGAAKH